MGRSMNTSAASAPGLKIQALEKFDGWRSWKLSGQMPIADRAFLALRQDHPVPRTHSSIDKIRAELAWVTEPVNPNVCRCRRLRCCESEHHAVAKCPRAPTRTFWSFRREYYCEICIGHQFVGSNMRGYRRHDRFTV
jgi:hypothetical protein